MHQVEALHVGIERAGELDRTGIVDADVDAAEFLDGLSDCFGHLRFFADVAKKRQRIAACVFNLPCSRKNRSRQPRMRLSRLCRNRHIGAVACRADGDCKADAARPAGYEKRLPLE